MSNTMPISVLLVDDNLIFAHIATRFLQEQDAMVVVGATPGAEETLAQARMLRPDIVLIDLSSANLPGLEAISYLRAAMPEVGIIATTLLDVDGYRHAALAAGADAFVSKTRLATDLVPAILRVVRADHCGDGTAMQSVVAEGGTASSGGWEGAEQPVGQETCVMAGGE